MFFMRNRQQLSSDTTVALTEAGKRQAEEWTAQGPRLDILSTLGERGPSSVRQLKQVTPRLSDRQIKAIIAQLQRGGLVRFTGEED